MHSLMFGFTVTENRVLFCFLLTQTHFGAQVSVHGKALKSIPKAHVECQEGVKSMQAP